MPILTLYGAKGGTGRTTAAAAIARGLLAGGYRVVMVETFADPCAPLDHWSSEFDPAAIGPHGQLNYGQCTTPTEIDAVLKEVQPDERTMIIFDTSPVVSAARAYAFELADRVVMPFTGFLDAEVGIAKAAAQLGRSVDLVGLPVRAPTRTINQVAEWMPVLKNHLPDDERLILLSTASHGLDIETAAARHGRCAAWGGLPELLSNLALEVTTDPFCLPRAPALAHPHASLRIAA